MSSRTPADVPAAAMLIGMYSLNPVRRRLKAVPARQQKYSAATAAAAPSCRVCSSCKSRLAILILLAWIADLMTAQWLKMGPLLSAEVSRNKSLTAKTQSSNQKNEHFSVQANVLALMVALRVLHSAYHTWPKNYAFGRLFRPYQRPQSVQFMPRKNFIICMLTLRRQQGPRVGSTRPARHGCIYAIIQGPEEDLVQFCSGLQPRQHGMLGKIVTMKNQQRLCHTEAGSSKRAQGTIMACAALSHHSTAQHQVGWFKVVAGTYSFRHVAAKSDTSSTNKNQHENVAVPITLHWYQLVPTGRHCLPVAGQRNQCSHCDPSCTTQR